MKKRTRLLSLFLSMLVTFGTLFASCKKKSEIDGSDADQNVGAIASNDSNAEENLYAPEAVDFGGYEFKLTRFSSTRRRQAKRCSFSSLWSR